MPTAQIPDRSLILIGGADAGHFLQNILTTDLDGLQPDEIKPGALLTPQGKILFDFLISRSGEAGFRLDCRADIADDFLRRLMLYKLRARVEISKQDQSVVFARWQNDSGASFIDSTASETDSDWLADMRFPESAQATRSYEGKPQVDATPEDFKRLRIAHGIAESGADYALSDAFPHDVLLDETGGIGFRKGCYVGQEVVSRMQHRGTARRRVMLVRGEADLPESGTEILVNGRAAGALASTDGMDGLAIVRIDRVKDALVAGHAIVAGDVALALSIPPWATYGLPQANASTEEA